GAGKTHLAIALTAIRGRRGTGAAAGRERAAVWWCRGWPPAARARGGLGTQFPQQARAVAGEHHVGGAAVVLARLPRHQTALLGARYRARHRLLLEAEVVVGH